MSQSIRVTIYKGCLAGATILYALFPYPHLDVHIFESASNFKEAGAAVGITCNTQVALELISYTATECLKRARAVPQKGLHGNSGPQVTTIICRAAFLCKLLAGLPPDCMHALKKLKNVNCNNDGSLTHLSNIFYDYYSSNGSIHNYNILIGANGIHSTVRKLILGKDDPAAIPRNSSCWAIMALKPYFVITAYDQEAVGSERWHCTVSANELCRLFQDWLTHLKKAVEKLERPAIYLWEHLPAYTYTLDLLCLVGNAAHAITPWQGLGGGILVKDSFILSPLLGHAKTTKDTVTREIITERGGKTKIPLDQVKEKLVYKWDFIFSIKLEKHRNKAISIINRLV
ncbi:salicylate hydroxylase [Diaporthe sp. PMI_573]|nr:salicylate hydroxylase [Diaporthaceae sp. PMI_573]